MSLAHLASLILLAALWGGSFLFMRIAVPAFGPVWLIALRVAVAAVFLLAVAIILKRGLHWRGHVRHHLWLGLLNSALPFLLFAYAAQSLTAGTLSVLNATSPLFGALIGWLAFGERPSLRTVLGLGLGLAGVATMVGAIGLGKGQLLPILAAAAAPVCYAIASHLTRRQGGSVPPFANACGSMVGATLLLLPLLPLSVPAAPPTSLVLGAALALGLLSTGVAYVLYFRLIAEVGAVPALSVTYLIPAFGIAWGALFLGESVPSSTWIGLAGILAGTALVTGVLDRLRERLRAGARQQGEEAS